MKRTLIGMVEAGEPLIWQTLEAIQRASEAEDSELPLHEVRCFYLLADSVYPAVIDSLLAKAGQPPSFAHQDPASK
ncbi:MULTISPECIES: hypothetical protein [Pseudomonadaceae]|jgi:hypothetical protein|uniref:Uncharacterized protein n=2 Tax=Pseudomonas TaxID=286 RepID=A0A7Y8DV82_PSETO|nr:MULTISPECIES: hypothetical protein [Pseudomonadaceae]MBF4560325.1 hypothetical protein [Pseudomonas sp. p50(2008)]MBF6043583.1 hypothetical protein [Pseudomonas mucoides]MBK3915700.1 hypothetical protein [Stutzerimonas frequens]MBX9410527.1 hypothetical protein [Pseudomonas baetica]MCT8950802.1 hypothetical protein [Pseudomonas iridis]